MAFHKRRRPRIRPVNGHRIFSATTPPWLRADRSHQLLACGHQRLERIFAIGATRPAQTAPPAEPVVTSSSPLNAAGACVLEVYW